MINSDQPGVTVFVCVSCRRLREGASDDDGEAKFEQPGRDLVAALESLLQSKAGETQHPGGEGHRTANITIEPVECLAVCKRPCTVAISSPGKWSYLIGDLDADTHAADVAAAALAYGRSEHGIVPWAERPATFRRGVVARVPPQGWKEPIKNPLQETS